MFESESNTVDKPTVKAPLKGTDQNDFAPNQNSAYSDEEEFATGLPSWDLVPPTTVIRRVKRPV
jgi:hypothetical protein